MQGLNVKIWGTRGSMSAPYPDRMIYGGNTSCVSVEWDDEILIFDCGSGIRAVSDYLTKNIVSYKKEIHIFISHLHLDHIMGLPFFSQIYQKDWTIHLHGTSDLNASFQERIGKIVASPYWPVPLFKAGAKILWHELDFEKNITLPGNVTIKMLSSNHPDNTTLFRLEKDGTSIVYGLDCELTETFYDKYITFVDHCDLLLFDGMYTECEIEHFRGFGHSFWKQGIQIMEAASVKKLCIMHHDWARTDSELTKMEQDAKALNENCIFAREGMSFCFKTGGMNYEI